MFLISAARLANENAVIPQGSYTDIIVTGNSSIANNVSISQVLHLKRGNLNSNHSLTLTSTAAATARVAEVNATATITGDVTVERFIPAKRAWRLLNAPLATSATQTVNASWQESKNNIPGFGTHITGGSNSNGFDPTATNSSSIKVYNQAAQTLNPMPSTLGELKSQPGYFVFVRGDRTISLSQGTAAPATNTVLRATGPLKIGDTTIAVAGTGFTLMGNPYAAPIDFSLLNRSNVVNRFYAWDPTLNQVGGYVLVDDDGDGSGNYTVVPNSSQTKVLQSGQAFFVQQNTAGSGSIGFSENTKSNVVSNSGFRNNSKVAKLNVELYLKTDSLVLADAILACFSNQYHSKVLPEDGIKLANMNENLAIEKSDAVLTIERRPFAGKVDTLSLKLWNTASRNYQFKVVPENFTLIQSIYLEDRYLKTITSVSNLAPTTFDFSITADPMSYAPNRFIITFRINEVLPQDDIVVRAYQMNAGVNIEWIKQAQENIKSYEVQKSGNGLDFSKTFEVDVNETGTQHQYLWYDSKPFEGQNYYRIKMHLKNGGFKYSNIIDLSLSNTTPHFVIFPNPAREGKFSLQIFDKLRGKKLVEVYNNLGQIIYTKWILHAGGSVVNEITLGAECG